MCTLKEKIAYNYHDLTTMYYHFFIMPTHIFHITVNIIIIANRKNYKNGAQNHVFYHNLINLYSFSMPITYFFGA